MTLDDERRMENWESGQVAVDGRTFAYHRTDHIEDLAGLIEGCE